MPDKRTLTIRLLKANVANPTNALKPSHKLFQVGLGREYRLLFIGQAFSNPPKWRTFFPAQHRPKIDQLLGAGPAAVLFVKVTNEDTSRWFAVVFGAGYFALNLENFESHFGMRVAVNRLGERTLRSIDVRRPEEGTIQTRTQSSKAGSIYDFGVDTYNMILQAVTGLSHDPAFGTTLTASDALKITAEVDFDTLDQKLRDVPTAYEEDLSEEARKWYGKVIPVRDRSRRGQLDNELVRRLNDGEFEGVHLAPPEIVPDGDVSEVKFTGQGRDEPFTSLAIENYLAVRPTVSLDLLQTDKVKIQSEHSETFYDKWSVYKCIAAEFDWNGGHYVLTAGQWYEVSADFATRINTEVADIQPFEVQLPNYSWGEKEGDYNKRVADNDADLLYFDKDLVSFKGEQGRIEFCDLLHKDKALIHVKKRTKSSTLSHLYSQVYASAVAFLDDADVRKQVRDKVEGTDAIIPELAPEPHEYRIVVALMSEGKDYLPFLSRVALAGLARSIRRLGFQLRLKWIEPEEPATEEA